MVRFVVAASCLVVLFGSSCGPTVPVPDAGRVTGGGLAGTGGGTSGTGGGSATGGGAAGGSSMSGDGGVNCVALPAVTFNGMAGSTDTSFPSDGGAISLYLGVLSSGPGGAAPFTLFEALLFNRTPTIPLALPLSGTFESLTPGATVFADTYVSLSCSNTGANCQQVFGASRGSYSITAATMVPDAGMFNGAMTSVRLVELNPTTLARIPDGGCLDLAGFTFTSSWP
jgi:hypothetical protein